MDWKEKYREFCLLLMSVLAFCIPECDAGDEDAGARAARAGSMFIWASVIGYVVIVVIFAVCGITVTVCAFVCCWCHDKRKRKCATAPPETKPPPMWSTQLILQPEFADGGFEKMSDGMTRIDMYKVMRTRTTNICSDGARWNVPMYSGKHLFEIIWHWSARGSDYAAIGVGTENAPLRVNNPYSLVGYDAESWGLLVVKRRCKTGGRMLPGACPHDGSYVPDRFFMFVDLDEGKLGYGADVSYWGDYVTDLPTNRKRPLYVLVGMDKCQSEVEVYYKGSADPNAQFVSPAISTYSMTPGQTYSPEAGPSNVISVKPPDYCENPTAPQELTTPGAPPAPPPEYLYNESPPPYSN